MARCKAKNKCNGQRCKNPAKNKYCWQHSTKTKKSSKGGAYPDYQCKFKTMASKINKDIFHLPVKTVTIVPSTKAADQTISKVEMKRRVDKTKQMLGRLFGGFTAVKASGGYWSDDKQKVIKEPVVYVESFASPDKFKDNFNKWMQWIKQIKKEWGQEAIGIIVEDDLFYI